MINIDAFNELLQTAIDFQTGKIQSEYLNPQDRTRNKIPLYYRSIESFYDYLFRHMQHYLGYDKLPQIVEDEQYSSSLGQVVYHGSEEWEHAKQMLFEDDYHIGYGFAGYGFYFSTIQKILRNYNQNYAKNNFTARLDPEANVMSSFVLDQIKYYYSCYNDHTLFFPDADKYTRQINRMLATIDDHDTRDLMCKILSSNCSFIAMLFDVDIIRVRLTTTENNYVILNRNKLQLSEKEYGRLLEKFEGQPGE